MFTADLKKILSHQLPEHRGHLVPVCFLFTSQSELTGICESLIHIKSSICSKNRRTLFCVVCRKALVKLCFLMVNVPQIFRYSWLPFLFPPLIQGFSGDLLYCCNSGTSSKEAQTSVSTTFFTHTFAPLLVLVF